MPRYIAFLRAINVGGHTVTMQALRAHFEALGSENVETFIASGNVIFESNARSPGALEKKIEEHLHEMLGYEVKTFIRTASEVAEIASYKPFPESRMETAGSFNVGFLAAPLTAEAEKLLMGMRTDIDDFHVHGREVYWLCTTKQSQSTFSNMLFEKKLKVRVTFRGMNTVARLAAKLPRTAAGG